MTPLAIDLFCGLGGWTEGLLAEGYRVVGFDCEQHVYGEACYPAQLVIQDVLTIHGRQFKDAALIVASPPCQEFSYMAMPWTRAKAIAADYRSGARDVVKLTALFDACFRIQREASDAAGHLVPLVVENVCGAQTWVGRARWHYGSFYLWGDVPALMPVTRRTKGIPHAPRSHWTNPAENCICPKKCDCANPDGVGVAHCSNECPVHNYNPQYTEDCPVHDPDVRATKNSGGSWFAVAHNTTSGHGQNPDGRKMPSGDSTHSDKGRSAALQNYDRLRDDIKHGGDWFNKASGNSISRRTSSRSVARKAASAHIAKIPLELARWIARAWKPC